MNVDGIKNLRRVVSNIPADELHVGPWSSCVGGTAAKDQYFIDAGFEMRGTVPSYDGVSQYSAFAKFLDIDETKVADLMSPGGYGDISNHYVTHEQVYAKLDKLLENA